MKLLMDTKQIRHLINLHYRPIANHIKRRQIKGKGRSIYELIYDTRTDGRKSFRLVILIILTFITNTLAILINFRYYKKPLAEHNFQTRYNTLLEYEMLKS